MIKFKDIQTYLDEKVLIKHNKGFSVFFNETKNHLLKDKLKRANISMNEFKSVLNKIVSKIKTDKLNSGNFNFIFDNFKLPVIFNKQKKEIFITTILTKNMIVKSGDKKLVMESFIDILM